jgi:hypothetical protein
MDPGNVVAAGYAGEWIGEWLGTLMYFGQSGEAATLKQLAGSGLNVQISVMERQDNEEAEFMWVHAFKRHFISSMAAGQYTRH